MALDATQIDRLLASHRAPERAINAEELPWIPASEHSRSKILRIDLTHGQWMEIFQVDPGAEYTRHRHGGPVVGFVLEGSWRYLERDWVATKGTVVFEPPGDIHTLVAGPEGMTTLFVIGGSIEHFDANGNEIGRDDVETVAAQDLQYCADQGIDAPDVWY
jgi:2,4'-dihydroxyacetophenone dioxygenase